MTWLRTFIDQTSTSDLIQIGILLVAFAALTWQLSYQLWNKRQEKIAIRKALLQEMLANMDSLFNGGIERPFLSKVFEGFLERLSSKIKDESKFQELISLYVDLMDYRAVTDRFWPPTKRYPDGGVQCTQKQLMTINKFLQYFGEDKVEEDYDMKMLEKSRGKAQEVRNGKQELWHKKLQANIRLII